MGGVIWLGPAQEAALKHLAGHAYVKVLLGPPSSGKSTILRHHQRQTKGMIVLPISGPQKTAPETLSALLAAADLRAWNLSEIEQRNLLTVFLQERGARGKRIVFCIDKISRFSAAAWSEIQRLRRMQFAGMPIVELIVVGSEADALLPPLDGLLQESPTCPIEAVHFLPAPAEQDVASYIGWRLAQFGIRNTFTEEACRRIASLSKGRFRVVNLLCQVILWHRPSEHARDIDAGIVDQAAAILTALKEKRTTLQGLQVEHLGKDQAHAPPQSGRIVVSRNGTIVRTLNLNGRIVIGRSDDNDLSLQSHHVSRHHAAIMPTADGRFLIVDFNSTNGMLVNGKPAHRRLLRNGDVVQLCQYRLKVELDETAPAPMLPISDSTTDLDTDIMPAPVIETRPMRILEG
jgi:hypothetical protein